MTADSGKAVSNRSRQDGGSLNAFRTTIASAITAIERLKVLRHPATPDVFEAFYLYATGQRPSLNRAIDDAVNSPEGLQASDIEQIRDRFISPTGVVRQIEGAASLLDAQIKYASVAIDSAIDLAGVCAAECDHIIENLSDIRKHDELSAAFSELTQFIAKMESNERTLRAKLDASQNEIEKLRERIGRLRNEGESDPPTGLTARKFFEPMLRRTMAEVRGRSEPLCLVVAGIDGFKIFNSDWGHLIGDKVLRLIGELFHNAFADRGFVARFDGDRFAAALPGVELQTARMLADQFRLKLSSRGIMERSSNQNMGCILMSFGIACAGEGDTLESLVGRAETCLLAAKAQGRNRVTCDIDHGDPADSEAMDPGAAPPA